MKTYRFGSPRSYRTDGSPYFDYHSTWDVETISAQRAIKMFRVGVLFPHRYSTAPIPSMHPDGSVKVTEFASELTATRSFLSTTSLVESSST